ncbi:hypothetical protein [Pseudomonas putida]|uniref:hypothetical protein n=1 Tax=Pseudomonas putida TaxID=303 RepID=UPI00300EBDEE
MPGKTPWESAIEVEPKTASERYLSRLAHRAFLSLWCYGNVHTDEGKTSESGDGKELCDLLVVFGSHILIFSDKDCAYTAHADPLVAWGRWYKRAVDKSVSQLLGAEKFIREHPDRLYLDKQCSVPFPFRLPDMKEAIIHRIAVTRGSHDAAVARWKGESSTSLMINTELEGKAGHLKTPFAIGWPAGRDRFVHVLDELTLDVLLGELDTVADLVEYFSEKERFFNSAKYIIVPGEEELIALYQTTVVDDRHMLPHIAAGSSMITVPEGGWKTFNASSKRAARDAANRRSYQWDHIIEHQSKFIRSAQSVSVLGGEYSVDEQEGLVRAMASETRFGRRMLVDAFDGVVRRPVVPGEQFTRRAQSLSVPNRYYAFTVMGRRPSVDYQAYRENRAQVLTAYCHGIRLKHPDAREVIGIAIDPATTDVTSQDVVYLDFLGPPTPEELAAARKDCDELGIMKDSAMTETAYLAQEFPEPKSIMGFRQVKVGSGNRAERRAQASAQRRKGGGKRGH